jgi:hypothetical protein
MLALDIQRILSVGHPTDLERWTSNASPVRHPTDLYQDLANDCPVRRLTGYHNIFHIDTQLIVCKFKLALRYGQTDMSYTDSRTSPSLLVECDGRVAFRSLSSGSIPWSQKPVQDACPHGDTEPNESVRTVDPYSPLASAERSGHDESVRQVDGALFHRPQRKRERLPRLLLCDFSYVHSALSAVHSPILFKGLTDGGEQNI